ncbi:hypothetical protein INR77_08840 [Erythrobacter sp. SCSIO 43205]|uniref:hypothetical protein n=1 Tax=Erythrobacter sp. SCSIO 43205 TaxID=2779361 RepID=UPI001CA8A13A|nr:hypothetical protein [Erythrobacter sp. SCSIO 43205]UAB76953.1 hypothetical protein INR77_08840 [Erythrobacter sp. SCSIO 43205]
MNSISQASPAFIYPEPDTGSASVDLSHVATLLDVIIDINDEMTAMQAPEAMQRLSDRSMNLGLIAHELVQRAQADLNPAPTAIIATFNRKAA